MGRQQECVTHLVIQDTSDRLHYGPLLYSPSCARRQQCCVQEVAAAAGRAGVRGHALEYRNYMN